MSSVGTAVGAVLVAAPLDGPWLAVPDAGTLVFPETDIEVTVTVVDGGGGKKVEFNGYGMGAVPIEVIVAVEGLSKLGETKELEFADDVGKPEVGRDVSVPFADGVGDPEGEREEIVALVDGIGEAEVGRAEMLEFRDMLGYPVEFIVGTGGKPDPGR